ncbi:Pectinesterase [Phytophthora nicotianae]|uniref:Pectinesterase n=1 Tax=Phytophthora nicotianae TaxID=4792 RepID=A0A0W8CI72_PHYNI|nr:Pectinesterase [Phytophthora nicotianae]
MRVYALLMAAAAVVAPVMAGTNLPQLPVGSSSTSLPTVELDYTIVQAVGGNTTVGYYKYQNIRFAKVPTGLSVPGRVGPADAVGRNLPVLVWTYGGGFTGGSKSQNTPEGLFDLSTDFVFVAYNYRLGITGLATGPTYQHEGGDANLCVWDSQHAFEWVQKYINNFGGNPDDVTAMGFSAGGSQVLFQMTRFGGNAPSLFHKAYVMSPGYVPGAGHHHGEQFWQNVSSAVGCDGGHLDCMREVNFSTLTSASDDIVDTYTYQMQPRVDGFIIPDTYEANLYQGHFNFSGPCVISHEQHEANSQAYSGVDTQEDVSTYLRIFFPAITDDVIEELLELYPESDYESAGLRFADMKQSFDLTGKNLALTHALNNQTWNAEVALDSATHGTDQSYYWYSTYTLSTSSSSSSDTTTATTTTASSGASTTSVGDSSSMGMTDGSSTGGPGGAGGMGGSSSVNATIAVMMQKYLLSFVLTGNPNTMWADDKIYWPQYNESSEGVEIVFNDTFTTSDDDLANAKSLFWNKALWY